MLAIGRQHHPSSRGSRGDRGILNRGKESMKRILTALLAAFALWAAAPSASQAQGTHGCACLFNRVGQAVQFQYKWGNQPFQTRTLLPGHVYSFCWAYGAGLHTSPPLHFML